MAVAFGLLRLTPQAFWAMTPRELERAMSVLPQGGSSPGRVRLSEMMRLFPDRGEVPHG